MRAILVSVHGADAPNGCRTHSALSALREFSSHFLRSCFAPNTMSSLQSSTSGRATHLRGVRDTGHAVRLQNRLWVPLCEREQTVGPSPRRPRSTLAHAPRWGRSSWRRTGRARPSRPRRAPPRSSRARTCATCRPAARCVSLGAPGSSAAHLGVSVRLEDVQDLPDSLGCEHTSTCSKSTLIL